MADYIIRKDTCGDCRGSGFVRNSAPKEVCPECKGKGFFVKQEPLEVVLAPLMWHIEALEQKVRKLLDVEKELNEKKETEEEAILFLGNIERLWTAAGEKEVGNDE